MKKQLTLNLLTVLTLTGICGCNTQPLSVPIVTGPTVVVNRKWEPAASIRNWDHIVVHHSATPYGNAALFHKGHLARGWDGLGYHFVIGNGVTPPSSRSAYFSADGQIEIGYRWRRQITGAHCGGHANIGKIGICLVGNFMNQEPSPRQLNALNRLIRFLQVRCAIASKNVIGHNEIKASTCCPGRCFSMAHLRSTLIPNPTAYNRPVVARTHQHRDNSNR
jgi:N-acetylmuramoyl-L-alanine amidase